MSRSGFAPGRRMSTTTTWTFWWHLRSMSRSPCSRMIDEPARISTKPGVVNVRRSAKALSYIRCRSLPLSGRHFNGLACVRRVHGRQLATA